MADFFGGGIGGGGGPLDWFNKLPPVTRGWVGATLAVTAAINIDFLKLTDVAFDWTSVFEKGEIWRCLTCFLYAGRFGFSTFIGMHVLSQTSGRYENMGPLNTGGGGTSSDYVFALLLGTLGILGSYLALLRLSPSPAYVPLPLFHRQLSHFVLYVWSKQRPHHRVNLFGVSMDAAYLPYAHLGLSYVMNQNRMPVDLLHGMFAGHLYYYFAAVVPAVIGREALRTPAVLIELFRPRDGGGDEPVLVDVDGVIGG